MHIFKLICMCCVIMFSVSTFSVRADSLWVDNAPTATMFADRKARAVGDIVTIIIQETSSASRSGKADNSKSAKVNVDAGTGSLLKWITEHTAGTSDSFSNKGSLTNTSNVTAKMTATVTEVRPNGNLVISGVQTIKQNKDEQRIVVSGVVRPEDITGENTVLSSYIADAQIKIDGKGPISDKQKQGIITQIWNFLF